MRILITQKKTVDKYGDDIDALERRYLEFLIDIIPNATIIPIPNWVEFTDKILQESHPDLIVLSGSNNLPGDAFGGDVRPDCLAPERDAVERKLLTYAESSGCPVFGICRGLQHINYYLGGVIYQNPKEHVSPGTDHSIIVGGDTLTVNSFHNYAVLADGLAPNCNIVAKSVDGVIEGLSVDIGSSSVLGVQWHPERSGGQSAYTRQLIADVLKLETA